MLSAQGWPARSARATTSRVHAAWAALTVTGHAIALIIAIVLLAVAWWWLTTTPLALAALGALGLLSAAALVDVVEHRLPNALVAAAAIPTVVTAGVIAPWSTRPLFAAVAGGAVVGGLLLVLHLVSPAGMGFGDVKAGTVTGAALGLLHTQVPLLALAAASAVTVVWGTATRQRHVPFGPGLVVGAVVAMAAGRLLGVEPVPWS